MFSDDKKVNAVRGIKQASSAEPTSVFSTIKGLITPRSGVQFTLTAAGLPEQTFVVVDFTLNEMLSSPFVLNVGLASADPAVDFAAVLDENATLFVWREGELQRSITGMIASFEQGDTGLHQTSYNMVIRPALWRTSLRRNSRIFQLQSIESIISTLLKENGINDFAFGLRNPHPAREFCVQYQESDFDFIQRLTAEEGIFYYFEFDNGADCVVFSDDVSVQTKGVALPYNLNDNSQTDELCISSFRNSERVRTGSVKLKDYTFKNPLWPAEHRRADPSSFHAKANYEHFDFPGRFKDEQHGKDFTRYRLDALRNDAKQGQGQSNCFKLHPGELFTLTDHPRLDLNTRWQIIAITNQGYQPQALQSETGGKGTTLSNQFTFSSIKQTWRPSPLAKPMMDGPQIAIVVGPAGEEIYCDKYGRVRLQFLWDRYGQSDDKSSCWIRVSQAWAGQGWGNIAIPRVGQEVIVDFLHGDPDQPIIVGRTYHANNIPPNRLPVAKTQMSIRSKTYKGEGFNELRFEDDKDREEVFIHAQKNMAVRVLNSKDADIRYNRTTRIGHDDDLVIANNRKITVEGQQDHKTTGNYLAQIDGDSSLEVKGDMVQKISSVFSLDANGDITLQSGSKLTLKVGGSFVVIHAGGVDIKGPAINLNSGGSLGDLLQPSNPAVLQAAAMAGSMFVAHCPLEKVNG